jgi:hypothetical protein
MTTSATSEDVLTDGTVVNFTTKDVINIILGCAFCLAVVLGEDVLQARNSQIIFESGHCSFGGSGRRQATRQRHTQSDAYRETQDEKDTRSGKVVYVKFHNVFK